MKINYQMSMDEALHIVRESLRENITGYDVLGDVTIEREPVNTSLNDPTLANGNRIWLIKMIRQLANDVNCGIISTNPGTTSNTIGLAEAKLWVEKYITKQCN